MSREKKKSGDCFNRNNVSDVYEVSQGIGYFIGKDISATESSNIKIWTVKSYIEIYDTIKKWSLMSWIP